MNSKSRLLDPGIILVATLLFFAAIVLIWWPTDIYLMGISLAGWLMFGSYVIWFLLALIYVVWVEKKEDKKNN
ncbi:hypothetical protein FH966_10670 [Lentibacillus cibarius]|uniref:DUF3311 domain-containing protein n=1 Tax=Lentibacillus cibarius TaxID=2583219 RepID=A0A549YJQ9_9BACI|nr:hypothetical protein [Lentibacillus cibarius]TRM12109.1 hypothetical protein FH966_10670 [Lentibacillus cibarius]